MGRAVPVSVLSVFVRVIFVPCASHAWVSPQSSQVRRRFKNRRIHPTDASFRSCRSFSASRKRCSEFLASPKELVLDNDDKDNQLLENLPIGVPDSFRVVRQYPTPSRFVLDDTVVALDPNDVQRLALTPFNVSLPVALMLLDPDEYPSFSRARKACRKGNILIHRGFLHRQRVDDGGGADESTVVGFDATRCIKGRVGDRVFAGDVIGKQVRMGNGYFPVLGHKKPPFELPVVYEDDHMALVNKPAGVVVYSQKNGGHGIMTVRSALPFVLEPPQRGTYSVMRRPASVHRLDKPTSKLSVYFLFEEPTTYILVFSHTQFRFNLFDTKRRHSLYCQNQTSHVALVTTIS